MGMDFEVRHSCGIGFDLQAKDERGRWAKGVKLDGEKTKKVQTKAVHFVKRTSNGE